MPGSAPASRPAASAARSRRRRRSGRRGGGRRWPANAASSGTCSRVWSVPGVVGSQPWSAVSTSRSRSRVQPRQPVPDRGVDLPQRAVEARDVLAVAVDLVGLDQVREHEARPRARRSARRWPRSPPGWSRPGARGRRRRRSKTEPILPTVWTGSPSACSSSQVGARRAGRARSPCAPPCARRRRARPSNGRAMTRPTACSPRMISRAAAHGGVELRLRHHVDVRGDLQHGVGRRVDDQVAGAQVLARRSRRSPSVPSRAGCRARRAPVASRSARSRRPGSRPGRCAARTGVTTPISSQWPVIVSLPGPSGRRRPWSDGVRGGRAARERQRRAEAEPLQHRQVQAARGLGDVAERVGARVAVVGGVRQLARAAGVEDDDEGAPSHGATWWQGQPMWARGWASK